MSLDLEWAAQHRGPWIASFRDGPCANPMHVRFWAVGPIERELYFIQHPRDAEEWMLVGYESVVPENPWPNQITYRLDEVVTMAGADGEPVAYYRIIDDD